MFDYYYFLDTNDGWYVYKAKEGIRNNEQASRLTNKKVKSFKNISAFRYYFYKMEFG